VAATVTLNIPDQVAKALHGRSRGDGHEHHQHCNPESGFSGHVRASIPYFKVYGQRPPAYRASEMSECL